MKAEKLKAGSRRPKTQSLAINHQHLLLQLASLSLNWAALWPLPGAVGEIPRSKTHIREAGVGLEAEAVTGAMNLSADG